jgi:lactate permease
MLTSLALLPFVLLLVLMVGFEKPVSFSAPVTFLVTLVIAMYVWQMDALWIAGSLVRSFSITLEIMFIIFGALLLLITLKSAGAFKPLEKIFEGVSADARIQAVLIGWLFVSFIEGIAGFGTPAMLAAPLLIALGFPAMLSVIVTLIGDSVAVTFGAVGVPITIGIAEGFGGAISSSLVGEVVALIHVFLSPIIPLAIIVLVGRELGSSFKENLSFWPLALVSGLSFTIPSYLTAKLLTPEFPSIVGALVGSFIMIILLRKGFFQPTKSLSFSKDSKEMLQTEGEKLHIKDATKSLLPYFLIIILLFITRMPALGIGKKLQEISFSLPDIFNLPASHDLALLYSPGAVFIIVVLLVLALRHINLGQFKQSLQMSISRIVLPFVGLFFVLAIVQLMIFSGNNISGYESMLMELAGTLARAGIALPFIAPFVGVLGSFISGSSTVSNLLFSSLQGTTALATGASLVLILALQAAGSAVGNMVAVHNVIAAQSVVGLQGKEGQILRSTFPVVLLYTTLVGTVGALLAIFVF